MTSLSKQHVSCFLHQLALLRLVRELSRDILFDQIVLRKQARQGSLRDVVLDWKFNNKLCSREFHRNRMFSM